MQIVLDNKTVLGWFLLIMCKVAFTLIHVLMVYILIYVLIYTFIYKQLRLYINLYIKKQRVIFRATYISFLLFKSNRL